ncbi:MAG: winged helix-turn-helix domain-containing protein [Oscillospiraceae bacterium]|nr:winged helix-turn-helix domain-containing protein [Oscillospiraceae bacterium]
MKHVQIRMLGAFTLRAGDVTISDAGNRSKKVWSLLAYLICNRDRAIPQQKLISLLWGDEPDSDNPENALRITLHRLRAQLDQLWEGAGREIILRKDGGYAWNGSISIELDCTRFETLCQRQADNEDGRLQNLMDALAVYQGDFLPRQSSEMWVVPLTTHFHNLNLQAALEAARLLSARSRHEEAVTICRAAAVAEPYHEPLHQILMQELAAAGDQKGAAAVYEALSKRLFDDFGIRPNEQTQKIYREAAHSPGVRTLPMDEVLQHLQEPEGNSGAMQCDYDYFKVLCYAESRAMERSGNATHIALLSLTSGTEKPLSKRSLERIMDQLGERLRGNLRRGDTISRCSVSQYIIMLPKANYENSCMVCRRVITAFHKAHPHINVKINFMVQPLTPSICVP